MAGFSKNIKGKFRVVKLLPGSYLWNGVSFDLRTITLKQADALYAMNCPYLKKIKTVKESSGKKT